MSRQLRTLIQRLQGLTQERLQHGFVTKFNAKSQTIEALNRKHLREGKLQTGKDIINLNDPGDESTGGTNRYSRLGGKFGSSASYEAKRRRKGLQTDHVDLRFGGEFYRNTKYTKLKDGGKLDYEGNDGIKYREIESRYGKDVIGVTEEDLQELSDQVAQEVIDSITAKFCNI